MTIKYLKQFYRDVKADGFCSAARDYIGEDRIEIVEESIVSFVHDHPSIEKKVASVLIIASGLADLVSKKDDDSDDVKF
jgi:hypothetical protein